MNEIIESFGDLEASNDVNEFVAESLKSDHNYFLQDAELMLDVVDLPKKFVVKAFMAGVDVKDLKVEIDNDGRLSIEGFRRPGDNYLDDQCLISECIYGNLKREVLLPEDLNYDSMHAQLFHGVLTIEIDKLNLDL